MEDQSARAGTVSAVIETLSLDPEDWHGFCLGFGTGHLGWALVLQEVETAELDREPIPTRQRSSPELDEAFLRQIGYDSNTDSIWFSYFRKGDEAQWLLEKPRHLNYERIRSDEKELRIDLEGGVTALVQLHRVDIPERVGDDS